MHGSDWSVTDAQTAQTRHSDLSGMVAQLPTRKGHGGLLMLEIARLTLCLFAYPCSEGLLRYSSRGPGPTIAHQKESWVLMLEIVHVTLCLFC